MKVDMLKKHVCFFHVRIYSRRWFDDWQAKGDKEQEMDK